MKHIPKGFLMLGSVAATVVSPRFMMVSQASVTKTVTLTSYSTEQWFQSKSDASFPNTKTVTYYDSYTHQTLTFSIPKFGDPKEIASKDTVQTSISDGANAKYDPIDHTRLGYMSDNTTTYWNGAYAYKGSPRKPTDYYGPDVDKSGWTLIAIHWADSAPQPAFDYPLLTKTARGYYWVSDGTVGQPVRYNTYRKGVWLEYKKSVKMYEWQQEYRKTVQIPISGGGGNPGGGSGGGGGPVCPAPTVPSKPVDEVLSYYWSPDGSGGQNLTWTDTHWVLQEETNANGCGTYQWVDQPKTYTHNYPLFVSNFAVTGLFYDPGKPGDLWSPTNTSASQRNNDQFYDGSTVDGNPALPTYGNPNGSPAIYVRVGGGFSFRLMWTGSPHDMPVSANVTYRLVNPSGESRTWTNSFSLLSQTTFNAGDVPMWDPNGNGYPPPATEYGWAYTSIPKYASQGMPSSYSELTAWNLTGDPNTAAHVDVTATFRTMSGSGVTWNNPNLAQALGYPTWYFVHEIQ